MKNIDGLELSPRKSEYVKYLLDRDDFSRTTDLSDHFKVDPSTITKTVDELAETGLLEHVPYRGFRLTTAGREYAEFLVRRHRLLGLMLSRYGLTPEEACNEASKFEGYVSKGTIDKICTSMGHPTMSFCGRITHDTCCCCPKEGE
jgi:DtxR family transcriptional regulator, Mn-dependent transcriptional regulator